MEFTVKTIMVAAALVMLFVPVKAAELESGFRDTQWATPAKDLKGFTKVGESEKFAYYVNPQQKYTFFGNEVSDHVIYGFLTTSFLPSMPILKASISSARSRATFSTSTAFPARPAAKPAAT